MAGTCSADLDQHLPRPRFWHWHVPELPRLLPLDELESLNGVSSILDSVELDLEV
jgi:hypothetical protein